MLRAEGFAAMASSKQPQPEVEAEELHPWVLLSAIPRTLTVAPRLALAVAGERVEDVVVELQRPPLISKLCAGRHIIPENDDIVPKVRHPFLSDPAPSTRRYPYIAATDSLGALLICASHRADRDPAPYPKWPRFFLCDIVKGTAVELPGMDSDHLLYSLDHPGRVGLIRDAAGRLLVADLQPVPLDDSDTEFDEATLLCHVAGTEKWEMVCVGRPPREDDFAWAYHGVHAHGGRLWWCDLSYGLVSCDPFSVKPMLIHTPFPPESDVPFATSHGVQVNLEKTRCVRVSGNKLRFVSIDDDGRGIPTVRMWSLSDEDGRYRWESDYSVSLTSICNEKKLLGEQVTVLAAVHPFNPEIIYIWLGLRLLGINAVEDKILHSGDSLMLSDGHHVPEGEFPSSRLLHAWVLPPALHAAVHDEAAGSIMHFFRSLGFTAPPFEPRTKVSQK